MNYVEELIQRGHQNGERNGRREGRLLGQTGTIESFLARRRTVAGHRVGHRDRPGRAARAEAASRGFFHTGIEETETSANGNEETA